MNSTLNRGTKMMIFKIEKCSIMMNEVKNLYIFR